MALVLISCGNQQVQNPTGQLPTQQLVINDTVKPPEKEKTIVADTSQQETKKPAVTVDTIKVMYQISYCGGAAPSEEILKQYEAKYPLSSSTLLFESIDKSKSFKVTTDKKGMIYETIKSGTYNVFMTDNYSESVGTVFTSSCEIWLHTCFAQVTIKEGKTKGYKIVMNFGCNPCEPPRP